MTRFPWVKDAISTDKTATFSVSVLLCAVVLATAVRWALSSVQANLTFATYFPAVLICSLLSGWRWGIVSAALSGMVASVLFPGRAIASMFDAASLANLIVFLICCAFIIATADTLRRTVRSLDQAKLLGEALNRELQHRINNVLSIVTALASQSAKSASPHEFAAAFGGRLHALAKANTLLGQKSFDTCALPDLVDQACEPFCESENIIKHGHPCLLPSVSCLPLVLALHELCTNAVKYGALSVPKGRVEISWAVSDTTQRLTLLWQEVGGPKVSKPSRKGLGSALLRAQSGIADVDLTFNAAGVRCVISVDGAETLTPLRKEGATSSKTVADALH